MGGGSDPIPTFTNHCFYVIFDPFFAENFRQIHGKNPKVRGGGSSRLGQIPNFYRKLVLGAPLTDVTADLQRMAIANKGDFWNTLDHYQGLKRQLFFDEGQVQQLMVVKQHSINTIQ